MMRALVLVCAMLGAGCDGGQSPQSPGSRPPSPGASRPAATEAVPPAAHAARAEAAFPLRVEGTRFVDRNGQPFPWRGITAFRLAEMIASGRETEAAAYLDWAAKEQLTVVRVLMMAKHLFALTPDAGRAALPRLLDLAKARGLAVEVVALADTGEYQFDHEAHIREIGRIAAGKGNALVEIANEPGHPTQDERVHDPAYVARLAALVPDAVIVALGSVEYGERYAGGEYVTTHVPRGDGEWDHVLNVAAAARYVAELRRPVISDEPIGAAERHEPGRRDNDPARFAAAAALTRLAGLGATYHYEGGLHARIPTGREAACLAAWQMGLTIAGDAAPAGEFVSREALASIAAISGVRASFARVTDDRAVILLLQPETPSIQWKPGWTEERRSGAPGFLLVTARRGPGATP